MIISTLICIVCIALRNPEVRGCISHSQLHVAVMRGFVEVVYHITRLLPHQALLDLANHTGRVCTFTPIPVLW